MRFAPGTSQAQMAAATAAANKPRIKSNMPGRGIPALAPKPKPNLPIRGVGPNDGGPKPMPSTGGPRQAVMPGGAPGSFYNSLMGGGAAPSQPFMGNNIANTGATAFKRSPATFQSGMKKGGAVKVSAKKMASGGAVSSTSKRGDGIAQRGKTKGRMV